MAVWIKGVIQSSSLYNSGNKHVIMEEEKPQASVWYSSDTSPVFYYFCP